MFQRLTNQNEGTGIDLAIVRKVVDRMDGSVGAVSEPDQGSRFWMEFHLTEKPGHVPVHSVREARAVSFSVVKNEKERPTRTHVAEN